MFSFCRCEEPAPLDSVAALEVYGRPTLEEPEDASGQEDIVQLPVSFVVNEHAKLRPEPPMISAPVWFLQCPQQERYLQKVSKVILSIYINGFHIRDCRNEKPERTLAWSPFAVVQACRFYDTEMDERLANLRMFKISDLHHGVSCLFAVYSHSNGEDALQQRAKWVAAVSCAIRMLTLSLFPVVKLVSRPALNAPMWTKKRLLAGHLLLFDKGGVTPAFCELHAPVEDRTHLNIYSDETCQALLVRLKIDAVTTVTERMGVDCSCFTLSDHHFAARTVAEKALWLRAISNVKVKLRHAIMPTSDLELRYYRIAVDEQISKLPSTNASMPLLKEAPFLARRATSFWPVFDPEMPLSPLSNSDVGDATPATPMAMEQSETTPKPKKVMFV